MPCPFRFRQVAHIPREDGALVDPGEDYRDSPNLVQLGARGLRRPAKQGFCVKPELLGNSRLD